ncbi:hypothetical protein GCM10009555_086830 [Acrocarpospora macrocephala]|uniref:WXG100 family type VII secretion target n=1 Tax=Acrocarpospora macrocephala TaxID=150177 RepID=A0A5M3WQ88_9ACTN|nr:hypothetical protein Amac_024790 [Acrocarpospora macrocephala]
MAQMVPNPLHVALQDTLRTVESLIQATERDLGRPCEAFQSGKVWTGPAAKLFGEQLAHLRTRVRTSGDRILADLHHSLSRAPRQVTEDEARTIRARYNLP